MRTHASNRSKLRQAASPQNISQRPGKDCRFSERTLGESQWPKGCSNCEAQANNVSVGSSQNRCGSTGTVGKGQAAEGSRLTNALWFLNQRPTVAEGPVFTSNNSVPLPQQLPAHLKIRSTAVIDPNSTTIEPPAATLATRRVAVLLNQLHSTPRVGLAIVPVHIIRGA
jgi:hypothetical protein